LPGAALWANRRRRWIDDTPTSKTTGVFIGLVEVQGTAEAEQPLTSHLAGQPCVYYSWSAEESRPRTVTETYTDSQGRTQTRTRRESGWTTVAQGQQETAFYLKDDLGVVSWQCRVKSGSVVTYWPLVSLSGSHLPTSCISRKTVWFKTG
jgi:hypothetical protein